VIDTENHQVGGWSSVMTQFPMKLYDNWCHQPWA
jgi:hypothetical protein